MPILILSPNYNTASKILRKTAQDLGWETFRLEDDSIPSLFAHENKQCAIYSTVPNAFNIAHQLNSFLFGCGSDWLVTLPDLFLKRQINLLELKHAESIKENCFIKPALGKSFKAGVRDGHELISETTHLPPNLLIHVSEVVEWEAEYRCFVKDNTVLTLGLYRRGNVRFSSYTSPLIGSRQESEEASEFANSLLNSVPCPRAFVLDVGIIRGKGWAVVEPNECWGAGIYACTPKKVLDVLLAAIVPENKMTKDDEKWDYKKHYLKACPHMSKLF